MWGVAEQSASSRGEEGARDACCVCGECANKKQTAMCQARAGSRVAGHVRQMEMCGVVWRRGVEEVSVRARAWNRVQNIASSSLGMWHVKCDVKFDTMRDDDVVFFGAKKRAPFVARNLKKVHFAEFRAS